MVWGWRGFAQLTGCDHCCGGSGARLPLCSGEGSQFLPGGWDFDACLLGRLINANSRNNYGTVSAYKTGREKERERRKERGRKRKRGGGWREGGCLFVCMEGMGQHVYVNSGIVLDLA